MVFAETRRSEDYRGHTLVASHSFLSPVLCTVELPFYNLQATMANPALPTSSLTPTFFSQEPSQAATTATAADHRRHLLRFLPPLPCLPSSNNTALLAKCISLSNHHHLRYPQPRHRLQFSSSFIPPTFIIPSLSLNLGPTSSSR